jgi:hypothetical protein
MVPQYPNAAGGGLWQGGMGPAALYGGPGASDMFFATGNYSPGGSDANHQTDNSLSNSVIHISPGGQLTQWIPLSRSGLDSGDMDIATSAAVPLPGGAVLVGGKAGYLYIIDQKTMTSVVPTARPSCPDIFYQDAAGYPASTAVNPYGTACQHQTFGAPAVIPNATGADIYLQPEQGPVEHFAYNESTRQLSLAASGATTSIGSFWQGTVVASTNGTTGSGLVWYVSAPEFTNGCPGVLTLVASDMQNLGSAAAFCVGSNPADNHPGGQFGPVVMDGRVYSGKSGGVSVFGL